MKVANLPREKQTSGPPAPPRQPARKFQKHPRKNANVIDFFHRFLLNGFFLIVTFLSFLIFIGLVYRVFKFESVCYV